jgi:hypothetical protein
MSKKAWKRIGGLLLIALPALFLVPGIGVESSHPAALARSNSPTGGWYYRVQPKDVLTTIAERELGTFKRYGEILQLNPGIKPRELTVGSVLRMPLRDPEAARQAAAKNERAAGHSPLRLLLSSAALLALVFLVVFISGRVERNAYEA